jgi:hypothetical protein
MRFFEVRFPGRWCAAVLASFLVLLGSARAGIQSIKTDLLIVGATESGWAAAIQAARQGVDSIVIVHDGEWFGGQYTEQALACVDENKGVGKVGWGVDWHPMKRSFHRSGLFRELMDRIEEFNAAKYGSPMPGKPYHGPSTFRPAEAESVFQKMIQPYLDSGQVRVFWKRYPVAASVDRPDSTNPRLVALTFAGIDLATGKTGESNLLVRAQLTIDASDWGDAIQVSGAAFECGPDPISRYGEPSAPKVSGSNPPNEMNPITWAMIVAESSGETPIAEPVGFDDRNYPRATHFSRKKFGGLKWDVSNPGVGSILHWPPDGEASKRQLSVFSVRRIVDGHSSDDGKTSILLNYMNGQDYPLERLPQAVVDALEATEPGASMRNIVTLNRAQRQIVFDDAKRHSRGVLYHLQNFVHDRATDRENSFRRFHLSREFGTADNLPPKPYIREGLRLKAMYMMREQDGRNRDAETKTGARPRFSHVMYPDGLFAWQFHYDFHRTGRTYLGDEGAAGPWIDYHKPNRHTKFLSDRCVFPLRSLIPERMDGLIGAQGNVGNSSIVSAAIRLHDQRIHVGQAAGATAAVVLIKKRPLRNMPYSRRDLEAIRDGLCGVYGTPLLIWPFRDLDVKHPAFVVINRLAALNVLPLGPREVDFRPDALATREWVAELLKRSKLSPAAVDWENTTRADVCRIVWELVFVRGVDRFAFARLSPEDADGDGIADRDDALLFTPNQPIEFKVEQPDLTPASDGKADWLADVTARFFNFCGPEVKLEEGETGDHGRVYTGSCEFGWHRDLSSNNRKRNVLRGPRDSFVFTRTRDVWECEVANGRYWVTVCVGDSGHEQLNQTVVVEGRSIFKNESTVAGRFAERRIEVEIVDGRLTMEIGSGAAKSNTCVNWLLLEEL